MTKNHIGLVVAALSLAIPAPLIAQDSLDTLRVDSLVAVVADQMQRASLAAARGDADAMSDARFELRYSVFPEILGELANVDCDRSSNWVTFAARELFGALHRMSHSEGLLATDNLNRQRGPESILEELENVQEVWSDIKGQNRERCPAGK